MNYSNTMPGKYKFGAAGESPTISLGSKVFTSSSGEGCLWLGKADALFLRPSAGNLPVDRPDESQTATRQAESMDITPSGIW